MPSIPSLDAVFVPKSVPSFPVTAGDKYGSCPVVDSSSSLPRSLFHGDIDGDAVSYQMRQQAVAHPLSHDRAMRISDRQDAFLEPARRDDILPWVQSEVAIASMHPTHLSSFAIAPDVSHSLRTEAYLTRHINALESRIAMALDEHAYGEIIRLSRLRDSAAVELRSMSIV